MTIELSVIIPNRNSQFTNKTIQSILDNAGCNVEVIVNVDEKWPLPLSTDKRVTYLHPPFPKGLRRAVNDCVALAKGKYIMKIDDHCLVSSNFGRVLIDSHQKGWVQIPRRYALDAENWKIGNEGDSKYPIDAMSLCFPFKDKAHDWGSHGVPWKARREERKDVLIDDEMSMQGSCYFMEKDHFVNFLGGLSEEGYGQFSQEAQEICNKTWLGGGDVKRNKKVHYAHLHKGNRYGRMYKMPGGTAEASNWSAYYWMENKWEGRKHDMKWLIEKFWPVPGWPDNWQEVWDKQVKEGWPNI